MSILIKDMKMPKEPIALIIYPDGKVFRVAYPEQIAEAVPVPPHGRLIDADALSAKLNMLFAMAFGEGDTAYHSAYRSLGRVVENAPTIIPAEEGET